jgi:hypothetical protein
VPELRAPKKSADVLVRVLVEVDVAVDTDVDTVALADDAADEDMFAAALRLAVTVALSTGAELEREGSGLAWPMGWPVAGSRYQFSGGSLRHSPMVAVL